MGFIPEIEKNEEECFQWLMESPVVQTRIQRMADAVMNLASGLPFHATKR